MTETPKIKPTVKDFSFGRVIGEGSYSNVVLATERHSGRKFACKILDKRHIVKEKKVKYVNVEKETLNKLRHPGIVRLHCTFQDPQNFILDLAVNGELLTWIRKLGSFDLTCTMFYAAEIATAVDYLHSQRVIHRDLKPENVLLGAGMHVKLTDFGTAKLLDSAAATDEVASHSFVGTAEYVSPELLTDKAAGFGSDWWALGCIIFQLLSGKPPFKGGNEYQTFQKIIALDYSFPPGFPEVAKDLVTKLLVLDPEKRLTFGQDALGNLQAHAFFENLKLGDGLWKETAPKLLPYLPAAEFHNKVELRSELGGGIDELGEIEETKLAFQAGLDSFNSSNDPSYHFIPSSVKVEDNPISSIQTKDVTEEKVEKLKEQSGDIRWLNLLQPNEIVLKYGEVIKRRGFFSKKRVLVLTDRPRLFYVDAQDWKFKGEILLSSRLITERKSESHFFIHTPHKIHYFEDPSSKSIEWIEAINTAITNN